MSTRSPRTGSARSTSATPSHPLTAWADLPRRQLALTTHSATAVFRGSQELRRIQQEAAERATQHYEETAEKLREPCDFSDLVAMQADLLRFNLQEAAHVWNELANAAFKWQADVVSSAGEAVIEGASEPTLESLQRAFEATLNGAGSATPATH
jgi:hypothetical protein